jgi:hypothetical protein
MVKRPHRKSGIEKKYQTTQVVNSARQKENQEMSSLGFTTRKSYKKHLKRQRTKVLLEAANG